MYVRFVGDLVDERTGRTEGIFTISRVLLGSGDLSAEDEIELKDLRKWFDKHLPAPSKFSRKKNDYHRNTRGISWMKDNQKEVMRKLYEMKRILDRYGEFTRLISTDRPGYIVYEDEYQVVAEPFNRETPD